MIPSSVCLLQSPHPQDTVVAEDQAHHEDPGQVQHQTRHIRARRHGARDQEEESSREIDSQGAPGQSGAIFLFIAKYSSCPTTCPHVLVKKLLSYAFLS